MYTLPVSALKLFASNSSFIRQNGILPVLDFVRFEFSGKTCLVYKTNLRTHYIQAITLDLPAPAGCFMADEKTLFNFVSQCGYENITLTPSEKTVLITDGFTKIKCPTVAANEYPLVPQLDNTKGVVIDDATLQHIKRAAKIIIEDEIPQISGFVFIGNGTIAATDRFTCYFAKTDLQDKILLSKQTVDALSKTFRYYVNSNYDAFETDEGIYLFSKPEFTYQDLNRVNTPPDDWSIAVDRQELISFLALAHSSKKNKFSFTEMVVTESLHMQMNDADYDITVDRDIDCEVQARFTFFSNTELMLRLFKSLPGALLHIYFADTRIFIMDEEKTFTALVMKYDRQPN